MRLLPVSFLLLPIAAAAAETPTTPAYSHCMERTGGVTADMIDCIGAEYQVQDKQLNAVYRRLLATLTPERQDALRGAQRLWLQYSEANCAFYADPDGGSLARVAANECAMRERAERAAELKSLLPEE